MVLCIKDWRGSPPSADRRSACASKATGCNLAQALHVVGISWTQLCKMLAAQSTPIIVASLSSEFLQTILVASQVAILDSVPEMATRLWNCNRNGPCKRLLRRRQGRKSKQLLRQRRRVSCCCGCGREPDEGQSRRLQSCHRRVRVERQQRDVCKGQACHHLPCNHPNDAVGDAPPHAMRSAMADTAQNRKEGLLLLWGVNHFENFVSKRLQLQQSE